MFLRPSHKPTYKSNVIYCSLTHVNNNLTYPKNTMDMTTLILRLDNLECMLETHSYLRLTMINHLNDIENELNNERYSILNTYRQYLLHRIYELKERILQNSNSNKKITLYKEFVNGHDDELCSICLNEYKENDGMYTSCGHKFHEPCITYWCETKKKTTCPMCKKNII